MAKFLHKEKAVSELKDLIRNADKKLVLISAYINLSPDLKELLTWRDNREKETQIIFRKGEVKAEVLKYLQGLKLVTLFERENLHVKCYLNDQKVIITSLNLLESSIEKNMEMGVLADKDVPEDAALYRDASMDVDYIRENSQQVLKPGKALKIWSRSNTRSNKSVNEHFGFCIRTGVEIPFDTEKPFSYSAYRLWNEYGNPDYEEKFCHFSGEPSNGETTYNKPVLAKNSKKAKAMFSL